MCEKLYVFGGVTSYMTGKSLNTTHEFSTRRESWQAVSVKGATIGERNSHRRRSAPTRVLPAATASRGCTSSVGGGCGRAASARASA